MDQVMAAGQNRGAHKADRFHSGGAFKEGRAPARQQRRFDSFSGQPLDQAQGLPLASAHRLSQVQVEDPHQLMFLALEYFKKV
jgi:hypothetical protein